MRWCVRAAVCLALLVNVTYGQCAGKNTQVDLEIVIDNSDGVTQADYDRIRSLSISFINEQEDGSSLSTLHAGVIVVGNGIDLRTAISNDHSQTASQFLGIDYAGSFRYTTSTGIEVAFNDLVTKVSPSNTRKVMIVFASKTSTDTEALTFSAGFTRQVGIEVFPVALNGFDAGAGSEIELMAGASNRDRIRVMANPASATSFPDVDLNLCGVGDRATGDHPAAATNDDKVNDVANPQACISPGVMFSVTFKATGKISFGHGHTLTYDQVLENAGGYYEMTNYTFDAPVAGLYRFTVHALSDILSGSACVGLRKNYDTIVKTLDTRQGPPAASLEATLHLLKDENVSVVATCETKLWQFQEWNRFSGHLMYEDDCLF